MRRFAGSNKLHVSSQILELMTAGNLFEIVVPTITILGLVPMSPSGQQHGHNYETNQQ